MLIERARRRERKTENIDTPNCSEITNTFIISTGRLERPEKNKIQSNEMMLENEKEGWVIDTCNESQNKFRDIWSLIT